mmetsp:Transcript_133873/g.267130  ORF Transcript_133873/g.267130 Transcript_133873/m.267130 type:complete len:741 (+) Transcript_133873:95-2317(+)
MQLYEELPFLTALFVCGFLGYMFVELVKWRAVARAKHMQKLEGLCEPDLPCTNAGTTVTMNPSDPAAYEETMKQPIHQQPNPRKRRQRNKKVARQACKAIHPVATRDEPPVSGDVNVDSSEGTAAAVNSDVQRLAENTPTVGTVVADKPLPSEMLAETAAGALAHGNAPTAAAGGECMTVNIDDAEADDEAEAEAQFVTNVQEASADDHEQPQVERVCQQLVLNPDQERRIQGDDMEKPEEVMANDESALGQQVEGQEEEEEEEEKNEPLLWESNGSVLGVVISVAGESAGHVFLLVTLIMNLQACKDTFMLCNQKDTPTLNNYGEVLLCHYTKGFVFCFPAMATGFLLLLCGRNLLQMRLYYGILKAGGVLSFGENTAFRDPFFLATFGAFCHFVGYTILHIIVLNRASPETFEVKGSFLEAAGTSTMIANNTDSSSMPLTSMGAETLTMLAVKGAKMLMMLMVGGRPRWKHGAGGSADKLGAAMVFEKYLETFMVLVATFLETTLLIIFFYFAYDITQVLVPMSEYLDSYKGDKENQRRRLHALKDSAAKEIFEHSPQIIAVADGDIHEVYEGIVERYLHERHCGKKSASPSPISIPSPEEPMDLQASMMERFNSLDLDLADIGRIGLLKALWPAELLMRRDIRGTDPKAFRWVWFIYSLFAIAWLCQVVLILLAQACWVLNRLLNKEFEQLIPLSIIMLHTTVMVIVMRVFVMSLAPLYYTEPLYFKEELKRSGQVS